MHGPGAQQTEQTELVARASNGRQYLFEERLISTRKGGHIHGASGVGTTAELLSINQYLQDFIRSRFTMAPRTLLACRHRSSSMGIACPCLPKGRRGGEGHHEHTAKLSSKNFFSPSRLIRVILRGAFRQPLASYKCRDKARRDSPTMASIALIPVSTIQPSLTAPLLLGVVVHHTLCFSVALYRFCPDKL